MTAITRMLGSLVRPRPLSALARRALARGLIRPPSHARWPGSGSVAAAAPCVTLPRRGLSAIPSAAAAEPAEVAGSASPPASGTVNAPATQAPDEPRDLAAIVPREATAEGADGSTAGSTAAVGEGGDGRRASQGILQARKEGRYSAVIELFEALTASGEASDARVLDAYVEAIAVTRSVAEAEEVCSAALAQREGMGRTAATYAALLKGCGADKGAALQLLGKMKEEGLAADLGAPLPLKPPSASHTAGRAVSRSGVQGAGGGGPPAHPAPLSRSAKDTPPLRPPPKRRREKEEGHGGGARRR